VKFIEIKEVINHLYSEFNKRNIDNVLAFMRPDVHWPNGWEGGYVEGHDEVRAYWTRQWKVLDPEVVPLNILPLPDGRIQVLVQQTVKDMEGRLLSANKVRHVYTFDNDLIKTMEIEPADN